MEVHYVDHMGDDIRVVNAARVSFNKESDWVDNEKWTNIRSDFEDESIMYRSDGKFYQGIELSEGDQKLIKYLAKHNHWTPFSHVMITMREKVPIFVARQRFKHMVGFTYNEISRRYVDDTPEFYHPDSWRSRPVGGLKQGSGTEVIEEPRIYIPGATDFGYEDVISFCTEWYNAAIEKGIAPEQARMVLPQSMYTEYYVTGSLSAWARAYKLRSDSHAQLEIQTLAEQWNKVISGINELKYSWSALT